MISPFPDIAPAQRKKISFKISQHAISKNWDLLGRGIYMTGFGSQDKATSAMRDYCIENKIKEYTYKIEKAEQA
jgi:hypothetical protein